MNQNTFKNIPVDQLIVSDYNVRKDDFDSDSLEDLKESIRIQGLINPISVFENENGMFEIYSGQRRFIAMKELGYSEIPCNINYHFSRDRIEALSLAENTNRESMKLAPTCLKYADFYKRCVEECKRNMPNPKSRDFHKLLKDKFSVQIDKAAIKRQLNIGLGLHQKLIYRLDIKNPKDKLTLQNAEAICKKLNLEEQDDVLRYCDFIELENFKQIVDILLKYGKEKDTKTKEEVVNEILNKDMRNNRPRIERVKNPTCDPWIYGPDNERVWITDKELVKIQKLLGQERREVFENDDEEWEDC